MSVYVTHLSRYAPDRRHPEHAIKKRKKEKNDNVFSTRLNKFENTHTYFDYRLCGNNKQLFAFLKIISTPF